jgi:TusE/DsrC/DsvC family sulfur relay protein
MATIECGGKKIVIDDKGFLINIDDWTESVAQVLAQREGLAALTDEQMVIIKFLRDYYKAFASFPILNYVCKHTHQQKKCVNEQFVNPEKAWRIAGLPLLDGIHFVSMDGGKHYLMEECC